MLLALLITLSITVFVICLFLAIFGIMIPPYTGVMISIFGMPWRSRGPGLCFRIPGIEKIEAAISLKHRTFNLEYEFETKNAEAVFLTVMIVYHPCEKHLINFLSFDVGESGEEKIEKRIKDQIRVFLSSAVRIYKNRGEVIDNFQTIAVQVIKDFKQSLAEDGKTLPEYYGVNLTDGIVNFQELPYALRIAEKRIRAMAEINLNRKLEIEIIKETARKMVNGGEAPDKPPPSH